MARCAANKSDLSEQRAVTEEEGREASEAHNCAHYAETSAKTSEGIDGMPLVLSFHMLAVKCVPPKQLNMSTASVDSANIMTRRMHSTSFMISYFGPWYYLALYCCLRLVDLQVGHAGAVLTALQTSVSFRQSSACETVRVCCRCVQFLVCASTELRGSIRS